MERVAYYLDASTEPKLKAVVEKELIAAHMKTLIEVLFFTLLFFFSSYLTKRWKDRVAYPCLKMTKTRVSPFLPNFFRKGITFSVADLTRMYNLFARVSNGLDFMRDKISNFLRETGKALVTGMVMKTASVAPDFIFLYLYLFIYSDEEKNKAPKLYVQSLLDLKDKYDKLLSGAFLNDKNFQHSFNQVTFI